MPDEELTRWAHVIHDAIAGKWVTLVCRDMTECRMLYMDCLEVLGYMGVSYNYAVRTRTVHYVVIGDNMNDGGIGFRTMWQEHMLGGWAR